MFSCYQPLEREEIRTVSILNMLPLRLRDLQYNRLMKQCQNFLALLLHDARASFD